MIAFWNLIVAVVSPETCTVLRIDERRVALYHFDAAALRELADAAR